MNTPCTYTIQHWVQDFSASGTVTDDDGQRAFALVNRATGQALVNKNIVSTSDKQVHVSDHTKNFRTKQ